MFGLPLLGISISVPGLNLPMNQIFWIVAAVVAYFAVQMFSGKSMASTLVGLPQRATTLLRFVDGLGVPFLAPLLQLVASGKWTDVPTAVHSILDGLDDKAIRSSMLDNVLQAQITNRVSDPEKKEKLLKLLEQKLGVTIPRA